MKLSDQLKLSRKKSLFNLIDFYIIEIMASVQKSLFDVELVYVDKCYEKF